MEYRFFYQIALHLFETKWRQRSDLENRTDIYVILPPSVNNNDAMHIEYGLKLRNGKKLELKKRERRFSNGQEYWVKTIHAFRKVNLEDMDSIIKALKKSDEMYLIERLTSTQPIIVCYVNKFREQSSLGHGLTQELTGLHLRFVRLDNHTQIGSDLFFETVCIEQSSSKLIDDHIIAQLIQQYRYIPIQPMGYPEFLFRQYQQLING